MAGGMNGKRGLGPLSERGIEPRPDAPQPPGPLKHCWVTDRNGRLPGLLLEWRRTPAGFEGRVVRAIEDENDGWAIVEEWLPAGLLDPA